MLTICYKNWIMSNNIKIENCLIKSKKVKKNIHKQIYRDEKMKKDTCVYVAWIEKYKREKRK